MRRFRSCRCAAVQPLRDQKMGGKVWFGSTSVGRRDGKKVFTLVNLHLEGRQASSRQQSKENRRKIQTNTVHIHTPKTSTNHHTNILTLCIFFADEQPMLCPWMYLTSWLEWSRPRSLGQARTSQTPCLSRWSNSTLTGDDVIDVYHCHPRKYPKKIIYSKIHCPTFPNFLIDFLQPFSIIFQPSCCSWRGP